MTTIRHGAGAWPVIQAREHSTRPKAEGYMLAGLNSLSLSQRTCLIVFQTYMYHTAEPHRSTYAQRAQYNMRKSSLFTKHVVRLMSEHDFFYVAQARLGLLKLTQPGKVDRWSFPILRCVAVKTRQFGQNSGHPFVWQVMRLRPFTTLAAEFDPLKVLALPSCFMQDFPKPLCMWTMVHTAWCNFTHFIKTLCYILVP